MKVDVLSESMDVHMQSLRQDALFQFIIVDRGGEKEEIWRKLSNSKYVAKNRK